MGLSLTGQNPYALSTSSQMQFASKGANSKSTSLSSGIRQDMSVVENSISSKLGYEKGVLTVVNKNMSYQKSQLSVMKNSLERMKETLAKMSEVVISSYNKSVEQRNDLQNAIDTYVELFNKQLNDAEFGDKKLLGGYEFNTDMRVGVNSSDTYNMKVDAINTMRGSKLVSRYFAIGTDNDYQQSTVDVIADMGYQYDDGGIGQALYPLIAVAGQEADELAALNLIVNGIQEYKNGTPLTGNLQDADDLMGEVVLEGTVLVGKLMAASVAVNSRANNNTAIDAIQAYRNIDLSTEQLSKAAEGTIKKMVNLIDGKLVEVNAYIDSVESISDSQQSKIEVTTETLDAYSKTDIVNAAQEFQDFLTKLKLSLQVLSSGQRLSDEAMQSVRSSLNE